MHVWYKVKPTFNESDVPKNLSVLIEKYRMVRKLNIEPDFEKVFLMMQGEIWSPKGEAKSHIKWLGLHHTSMSVGDLIRVKKGNWWIITNLGFNRVKIEGE